MKQHSVKRYSALMFLMTGAMPMVSWSKNGKPDKEDLDWAKKRIPKLLKKLNNRRALCH